MSRLIFFSHRKVIDKGICTGPGIRIFEMTKALQRKGHLVTIAEKSRIKKEKRNKISFIPWTQKTTENIEKRFDVAILQSWNDNLNFLSKLNNIPKVIDLYCPTLIEHANFCTDKTKDEIEHKKGVINYFFDEVIINLSRIIMAGDFFLCASKQQKTYYTGLLNILGIINPETYNKNIIDIVPFGVSEKKPNKKLGGLDINQNYDDKIIIWPGGINTWFDAITPIKAMKKLSKENPKIKLVFVGANNPLDTYFTNKDFEKAKKIAKKEGLLEKNVFFINWIPYEKREIMYNKSELAVITSTQSYENKVSHRTRVIDCFWGEIPVIITKESDVAEKIKENNMGIEIPAGDYDKLAEDIKKIIYNKKLKEKIIQNIKEYKKVISWDNIILPLDKFCKKPTILGKQKFNTYNLLSEKQRKILLFEKKTEKLNKIIKKQKAVIKNQTIVINKFKGSVIYPIYHIIKKIEKIKTKKIAKSEK